MHHVALKRLHASMDRQASIPCLQYLSRYNARVCNRPSVPPRSRAFRVSGLICFTPWMSKLTGQPGVVSKGTCQSAWLNTSAVDSQQTLLSVPGALSALVPHFARVCKTSSTPATVSPRPNCTTLPKKRSGRPPGVIVGSLLLRCFPPLLSYPGSSLTEKYACVYRITGSRAITLLARRRPRYSFRNPQRINRN